MSFFVELWLYVRALCGDANATHQLMIGNRLSVKQQQMLANTRNVNVQSEVARHTRHLHRLVFPFMTLKDMDWFITRSSERKYRTNNHTLRFRARITTMDPRKVREFAL